MTAYLPKVDAVIKKMKASGELDIIIKNAASTDNCSTISFIVCLFLLNLETHRRASLKLITFWTNRVFYRMKAQ